MVLLAPAGVHSWNAYQAAAASYDAALAAPPASLPPGVTEEEFRKRGADASARMAEQNALLFQWAVLLLGAIAALVTTSKVHRIGHVDTVYVLLAPAAAFLLGSIFTGVAFQRSLTFLVSQGKPQALALNDYLLQQGDLLLLALIFLSLFVVVFYLLIVFGGADPTEAPADAEKERA